MDRSAAATTHGAAASYGPKQSNRGRAWWCHGWFACLGGTKQHMSKIRDGCSLALNSQNLIQPAPAGNR
jgi:hypothetical protein